MTGGRQRAIPWNNSVRQNILDFVGVETEGYLHNILWHLFFIIYSERERKNKMELLLRNSLEVQTRRRRRRSRPFTCKQYNTSFSFWQFF